MTLSNDAGSDGKLTMKYWAASQDPNRAIELATDVQVSAMNITAHPAAVEAFTLQSVEQCS